MLALIGAQRRAAEVNIAISLATLIAAAALVLRVIGGGPMTVAHEQFFVDPFNVFLIALTALVGFTTAVFSRPYMRIEQDHSRLSARRLRLYHSMYQLFMTAMLVALSTNNMGLLWVAMEAATLSTVLLVSLLPAPAPASRRRGSISSFVASVLHWRCLARSWFTLQPSDSSVTMA